MMILNEIENNADIDKLISICKSNSGVMGTELRAAHHELGERVGMMIERNHHTDKPFAVVLLMRSASSFGQGIADVLDCPLLFLDEKHDKRWKMNDCNNKFISENREILEKSAVILADAVINTGETITQIYDTLAQITDEILLAANVIQSEFDPDGKIIYGTRRSDNKFKGSQVLKQEGGRGPDTGDRLFRTLTSMENSKRSVVVQGGLKDSDGLHDPIQT